jgi:hypothetical protein
MGSRWREFVENILPWFDATVERSRDRRTEAIRQRSIASRIRAERVIDDYRRASKLASRAGERVIEEARRSDDR